MILDPYFYLVAIPAVLIVGISKGGFGGGLALVGVPILALVISPTQAAGILLPILCVMDLFALWGFRGKFDKKNLMILLPAAAIGVGVGAWTFRYLNEDHIKLMVGVVTLSFCINWLIQTVRKVELAIKPATTSRGLFWGMISGFTSFSVHAGGPPLNFYLLPQRLDKTLFVGTTVVFFALVNFIKLVPYAYIGLLPTGNLATSLVLIPLAPLGVKLGLYLHSRIDTNLFFLFIYLFLFITGFKLIYDAISAMIL